MADDDSGTVRWFGQSWRAPVNNPRAHIATPTDTKCAHCNAPIEDGDQGITMPYLHDNIEDRIAYHLDCFLHTIGAGSAWDAWKDGAFQ